MLTLLAGVLYSILYRSLDLYENNVVIRKSANLAEGDTKFICKNQQ